MSSNCGKCDRKLGIYEYNLVNNEVVCDYCAEGRIQSNNPLPEDSNWKAVVGFDQLKSVDGKPSNMFKILFFIYLIITVLLVINILHVGQRRIGVIDLSILIIMTYSLFEKKQKRESYKIQEHTLIITSASDHSERVVDLRKVDQYNSFNSNGTYNLTLFTKSGAIAVINAYYIKNCKELFSCIKQNLDTINVGKYFTNVSTLGDMTITFVDPKKVRLEK